MSAGRTHLTVFNAATVPQLVIASLAKFSNQTPDLYGFGMILRGLTPGFVVRTGLVSGTAHIEVLPGRVFAVMDAAGANEFTIIHVGAPGATEVLVEYDDGSVGAKGTPTLTFNGAQTGYQIEKHELPVGFDEVFDAIAV